VAAEPVETSDDRMARRSDERSCAGRDDSAVSVPADRLVQAEILEHATDRPAQADILEHATDRPAQADILEHATDRPAQADILEHATDRPAQADILEQATDRPAQADRLFGLHGPLSAPLRPSLRVKLQLLNISR
jgi:hypothetical protein